MLAGASDRPVDVPAAVEAIAGGQPIDVVWRNELGGLTFRVGGDPHATFIKWNPKGNAIDLRPEVERLRWASTFTPVPTVVAAGADGDGSWIVTAALPGTNAVADRWVARPEVAVRAIGSGLRRFHDRLPVSQCPFSWAADDRVADARRRADAGSISRSHWHEDFRALTLTEALAAIDRPPVVDHLVVCHGDACAPNTLIGTDGAVVGHVDLGSLGVTDRWADLAVATWSTVWNYGPGWEEVLLYAYGVDPDPERTAYYRLLWVLGP